MNIRYVTKKIELTNANKADIEKHFGKFEKVLREPYSIVCTVEKKPNNKVKLELTVDERKLYRIEAYADSLENAVDDVETRMYRILRKSKEKKTVHKTKSIKSYKVETEDPKPVLKIKQFPIKPCTIDEAIDAMLDTDHDFYVFRNEETDSNDVVYLRNDGSIGLIQLV